MPKEYIEREALLNQFDCCGGYTVYGESTVKAIISRIKSQPAADVVEVGHGEWIYGEFDIPHCSECGVEVMPNNISNYCPNCGAKMDGKDGEQ